MIRLCLYTPEGTILDEDVVSFTAPSLKGPLQIVGGYTPIFESLAEAGILKVEKENGINYYAIFHSSLRVEPMKALLCCANAEVGYDIDTARANDSLKRAKARLEEKNENIDVARAKASMTRALVRLEAKALSEGS